MENGKLEQKLKEMNSADEVFDEFIERNVLRAESGGEVFSKRYADEIMIFTKYFLQNVYKTQIIWKEGKCEHHEKKEICDIEFRCQPYNKEKKSSYDCMPYDERNYIILGRIKGEADKEAKIIRTTSWGDMGRSINKEAIQSSILALFADRSGLISLSPDLYLSHLYDACWNQCGNDRKSQKLMVALADNRHSREKLDNIPSCGSWDRSRGGTMRFYRESERYGYPNIIDRVAKFRRWVQ